MKLTRFVLAFCMFGIGATSSLIAVSYIFNWGYDAGTTKCEAFYEGDEEPETIGPL